MCKTVETATKFSATPLAQNRWGGENEVVPGSQLGEVRIHRDGTWDFEFEDEGECWKIYAVHLDGIPTNFSEFLGDKI